MAVNDAHQTRLDEPNDEPTADSDRPDECACTPPVRGDDGEEIGGDLPCWLCWLAGYRSTPDDLEADGGGRS